MKLRTILRSLLLVVLVDGHVVTAVAAADVSVDIADRRELLVDHLLIDKLTSVRLRLHEPRDEGVAFRYDLPWEGGFCAYNTIIRDGDRYRAYYRGQPLTKVDGVNETTCIAESADGIRWTKPKLGLVEYNGSKDNNIVLRTAGFCHNFSPFIDTNPATPPAQRYKAISGIVGTGLCVFVSEDGLRWKKLREEPVLTKEIVRAAIPEAGHMFDSQNLAFWSATEGKYVSYFRVIADKTRLIARAESDDLLTWTNIRLMKHRTADGSVAPREHLYTNQTHAYFRAPHLYVAVAARFMPGRKVVDAAEAAALGVDPKYARDTSDAIFMTTRGGDTYDRTFLSSFIRPGIGGRNWTSRTNYPSLNVVQTGEHEMSAYVNQDYAQPTAHLRRYSLRLDGFGSARAEYEGGELLTKPLTFKGDRLLLNFATSAAGGIRVELQSEADQPIPGYTLADSVETIGNEIERTVKWKAGADVAKLAGKPVRIRFVMKDADLFALRFQSSISANAVPIPVAP